MSTPTGDPKEEIIERLDLLQKRGVNVTFNRSMSFESLLVRYNHAIKKFIDDESN